MHDDQPDLEPIAETARRYTRLGIMVLPSHYPIRIDGPDQHSRRYACSCGRTRCPTPAKHPIGRLTINDATVNLDRVAAWWTETPYANVASPAGRMFDVLQLTYPRPATQILDWLDAHGIEPGPVIATAPNLLQFPVRGSAPTMARYTPSTAAGLPDSDRTHSSCCRPASTSTATSSPGTGSSPAKQPHSPTANTSGTPSPTCPRLTSSTPGHTPRTAIMTAKSR